MKKYFITTLLILIAFCGFCTDELPKPFIILPQPCQIILHQSKAGLRFGKIQQIVLKGNISLPVMGGILSKIKIQSTKSNATLKLILDRNFTSVPSDEGYQLTIENNNAKIIARSEAGIFYGCQSLEQLLEDSRDYKKIIPACEIIDYPKIAYRAVHFDVKHHLDHLKYYYESIDRLARYKINAIVFEFEDKLGYKRQPIVASPQNISIEQMKAMTLYAKKRFIEITPLVQGLGHATFILKYEQYKNLRELPFNRWAFCPMDEGTYKVLFDLYKDAIDATPGSKYLHIGGDEIGNIGLCARCKPIADKEGMMSLNLYWLKRVCQFAKKNNRIPIFWDDMPLKYAGVIESTDDDNLSNAVLDSIWRKGIPKLDSIVKDFPNNCVYMRWNYSMAHQPGNIRVLDWYNSRGLQAMIATATNKSGGIFFQVDERNKGNESSGIINIKSFNELAAEKNISGSLCTAWDDGSPHMENRWRGFIASAEYSWSTKNCSLTAFDSAWLQKEFGVTIPDYYTFNQKLRKGSELWYEAFFKNKNYLEEENILQSVAQVEHWLKPVEGRENVKFDYTTKLIELPDFKNPGTWSIKYKDKLDRSLIEVNEEKYLLKRLIAIKDSSLRNKYFWQLSIALYNFQCTTAQLLVALKETDVSDQSLKQKGFDDIKKAMRNFWQRWEELKLIYSQTRYISYPSSFVKDRYFHIASQREDLSWMIQPQELYFEMIKKWMRNNK